MKMYTTVQPGLFGSLLIQFGQTSLLSCCCALNSGGTESVQVYAEGNLTFIYLTTDD